MHRNSVVLFSLLLVMPHASFSAMEQDGALAPRKSLLTTIKYAAVIGCAGLGVIVALKYKRDRENRVPAGHYIHDKYLEQLYGLRNSMHVVTDPRQVGLAEDSDDELLRVIDQKKYYSDDVVVPNRKWHVGLKKQSKSLSQIALQALRQPLLTYVRTRKLQHVRALALRDYPGMCIAHVYDDLPGTKLIDAYARVSIAGEDHSYSFDPVRPTRPASLYGRRYTLLACAIFNNDLPMVNLLMELGADPNKMILCGDVGGRDGFNDSWESWETHLSFAYALGRTGIVHCLLASDKITSKAIDEVIGSTESNVDYADRISRGQMPVRGGNAWCTLLMRAAGKGDDGMVQMLIDKKANVDAHNHNAKPALVYAARNGHLSIVRVLLAANANPDGPHRRVRTPLAHACQEGHLDVVHALVAAGAAIDREDFYRDNGLTLAIDTARDALYGYDEAMRRKTKKERDTIFARQCETIRWMLFYGAAIDHVGKFKTPRTYLDATEFIMQGINVFQIPRTEAKDLKTGR